VREFDGTGALDLGYKATVAADAAAPRDLPDPLGGTIGAERLAPGRAGRLGRPVRDVARVDQIAQK
jgi:hypothetical protein